ncbi:hypothetical protein OG937_39335 [Streptomyces sp. NBC_00510]
MSKFDMNREDVPVSQGRWDWWHVFGGHDRKGLPVRAGSESDPRIIRNPVFSNGESRTWRPSLCDGGPVALLDLEGARSAVAIRAEEAWEEWRYARLRYPAFQTIGSLHERARSSEGKYSFHQASVDYRNQSLVKRLHGVLEAAGLRPMLGDPLGHFGDDPNRFIRLEVAHAIPTNVLLTLDGRWIDGTLLTSPGEGHPIDDEYFVFADNYLSTALDPDSYMVRVRFHS